MPPILNNDQYTSLIPMEGKQQDEKPHLIPFFPTYEPSDSFHYPISYDTSNGEATNQNHYIPQKVDENNPSNGSSAPISFQFMPISDDHSKNYVSKRVVSDTPRNETAKWMSSKMRLMRKMMSSCPQQQEATGESSSSNYNNCSINGGTIRVCSDCNTTKTPLWRSGPQGPKSLCNACGIRQRKARKAMAAATITKIPDQLNSGNPPTKACKQKVWSFNGSTATTVVPFKKRYKMEQYSEKKIGLENFGINLNKNISAFHHPQDEKEAAILLMALSCDLMCS